MRRPVIDAILNETERLYCLPCTLFWLMSTAMMLVLSNRRTLLLAKSEHWCSDVFSFHEKWLNGALQKIFDAANFYYRCFVEHL